VVREQGPASQELHEAAEHPPLTRLGSSRLASRPSKRGLGKALAEAVMVVKRAVEATTGELTSELQDTPQS
jgi:hypothetical protein